MKKWMIQLLRRDHMEALGTLRARTDLWIADVENDIYVRSPFSTEPDPVLLQLPSRALFWMDEENRLFRPGGLTPESIMPAIEWKQLKEWMPVTWPVSRHPAIAPPAIDVQLTASDKPQKSVAILCTLNVWKLFATSASAIRLQGLSFAVNDKQEVLIMGHPLPPVPGGEYWMDHDILLPAGFTMERKLVTRLLSWKKEMKDQHYLMARVDGPWELIPKTSFVPASRSAVRLTKTNV